MTRQLICLAVATALAGPAGTGCKGSVVPGAAERDATAMGSWPAWRDLSPLVEVVRSHADKPTVAALEEASKLLQKGKARSADQRLSQVADASGRHWVSVGRANIAALYFTVCIRGVAWRLSDSEAINPTDRKMDFDENTRIEPGDVSVEALLTNLDAAVAAQIPALTTQARIARARVAAFASRCAANPEVGQLAQSIVEADLATLAAEGHLTPDLAYLWAGVQMTKFSGHAARPFLLQARDGGFDHPAVTHMLAVIALEQRDLALADQLAGETAMVYGKIGDTIQQSQALYLRGEVARSRKNPAAARKHYLAALKLSPQNVAALLGVAQITGASKGEDAARDYVRDTLPSLLFKGPLQEPKAREAAANVESLVIAATEPHLAQLTRDALVNSIDDEPDPVRRGIRYFYAATLDVRLREYQQAHGHAVLAKEEFSEADFPPPVDVEKFLERLTAGE